MQVRLFLYDGFLFCDSITVIILLCHIMTAQKPFLYCHNEGIFPLLQRL